MNDSTTILPGHTKKYQIPLSHLEHRYVQQCTNGLELERIYKELKSGQEGSHPILEQITLDRIRNILPDSQILRQNKLHVNSLPSASVINHKHQETVPKSTEEWQKLESRISREFNSDNEEDEEQSTNKHLDTAEEYRSNAERAWKSNNYQQAIHFYTESLALEKNLLAYINRAIAYFQLNQVDACIEDCFQVLSMDSQNVNALIYRAQCYLAKAQFDQAKRDLDQLLTIDSENSEAQDLMNTLITLKKSMQPGDHEGVDSQPSVTITSHFQENQGNRSMNIDIPQGENHPSNPGSPLTFDQANSNQFQTSSSNDEDDMALGDEAGAGIIENLSEEEGHGLRSINVSPTNAEDSDPPELLNEKPLINPIDQSIAIVINENTQSTISHHLSDDDDNDDGENALYDYQNNNHNHRQHPRRDNHDTLIPNSSIHDAIQKSDFGSIIQSWLSDFVTSQSHRRLYDRPWSKSSRPWSLDRIQRDIEKFNRFNDYNDAIEVSKKMLQNGVLDYHYYAEYIADTLIICAQSYLKLQDYLHAIQYATEALQYNKVDGNTLMYRGKAFENEKLLLFSYADYARVTANNFNYHLTQRACDKLTSELNSTEGETWREKLPNDQNDAERYFSYLKQKTDYSEANSYQWYERSADQFSLDACFVLAIRCYTYCIELQPQISEIYLKRAACYLKVFEPQKVLDDCEVILKKDLTNFLALYYKASAYKISRDYRLYELTLKEYLKLQPNNQIVLAEYYTYRHEQIPRKKRRIRRKSIEENALSYEELEQIRLEEFNPNSSLDSHEIKDQCAYLLHLQSFDSITTKLIENMIHLSRLMIQTEEHYQQEQPSMILPFSYMEFCYNLLVELTKSPQIDLVLSMMEENARVLLNELISFYSSKFDDVEKLNRLKRL